MLVNAVTQNIEVKAEAFYLPEQSDPYEPLYVFAYQIQVSNFGTQTVQLLSRHWVITDSTGEVKEVRGEGVVGEQPTLKPGDSFQYTSGSHLKSEMGTMEGSYHMKNFDGPDFLVQIPCFTLALPNIIN